MMDEGKEPSGFAGLGMLLDLNESGALGDLIRNKMKDQLRASISATSERFAAYLTRPDLPPSVRQIITIALSAAKVQAAVEKLAARREELQKELDADPRALEIKGLDLEFKRDSAQLELLHAESNILVHTAKVNGEAAQWDEILRKESEQAETAPVAPLEEEVK